MATIHIVIACAAMLVLAAGVIIHDVRSYRHHHKDD